MQTNWPYPPVLSYDRDHDAYRLSLPGEWDGSFHMLIKRHGGEDTVRFVMHLDGDEYEILTPEQYKQRVQDIRDNEGDEIADLWAREQDIIHTMGPNHPVWDLHQYWEAMMKLGLFQLNVSMSSWNLRRIKPELAAKLDELREKQRQAQQAEEELWLSEEPVGTASHRVT